MINRQVVRNAIFVIFATAATFIACGNDSTQTATEKYCSARCTCEECKPAELASCNEDMTTRYGEAKDADCTAEFSAFLTCVSNDATCADGAYDESFCFNEETDVKNCTNPPPACKSMNDGICDEPAPLGNGTCPTGSDKADCGTSSDCTTTNDGICNEPAPLGNGTCLPGTDTFDCSEAPTCTTTNDGVCNEPAPLGNGTCSPGTDGLDCTCDYTADGTCDEPEGTGFCPQGTDPVDCVNFCASTKDGTCDEPEGTGLCPQGSDEADCEVTCTTTNNGVCDEPQGTGNCPAGTDTADCPMSCVTCAEYATDMQGELCAASLPLYEDLIICACQGPCATACGSNLCMDAPPSSACGLCLQTGACATEFGACVND